MRASALVLALLVLLGGTALARTIEGTSRSDRLVGTTGADVLQGRGGNDRLVGLAGTDFLSGGTGRDRLDAGRGNDRIVAQYDGGRDGVLCGPGLDVVNADLLDAVAADCELVGRRLSRDPYTTTTGQHETQVEPDSLTVGRTTVVTFQVGRRFDGAADNIGYSVSADDGRTWRSGLLPGLTQASRPAGPHVRASDPVVAYDAATRTWLISTLAIQGTITRLTISRSTDGVTWSNPVIANEAASPNRITFDKNWIACDNGSSSARRGRCYLAYTDTVRDGALAVLTSTDGGVSWSAPAFVPVTDAVGAFPVIRPTGELVVIFNWGGRRIGSSVSADGGATFGAPVEAAEIQVRSIRDLRFFPLPSADVDPSGRIWVTWHDCRFDPACDVNSALVSTSPDGSTWSAPVAVTSRRNAFIPAIGIHPRTGRVAVVYHVVRAGGIDVELVESPGRANGFGAPRRLSAQTMRVEWLPDTVSGRMLADYISVHYAGNRPLAAWVLASEPVGESFRQAVFATRG
jgi:RTX calcium-binding nonapeptide repeat (4 copies)